MYFTDAAIDRMIEEDVPYCDLTTQVLGIGGKMGRMEYVTRQQGVLCGTEEAERILAKLGMRVLEAAPSGTLLEPGQVFLQAEGRAEAVHISWKVTQNVLEYASGIASKTRRIINLIKEANPRVSVVTSRKSMPGGKQLAVKAIMCGGAFPHRLGLSETILVFREHMDFMGGVEGFLDQVHGIKARAPEKKLVVETDNVEEAGALARSGVDAVQFDKLKPEELRLAVPQLRAAYPQLLVLAAGGIDEHNAAEFAASGVDALVTSSLFHAKSMDMSVRIYPLEV